MIFARQARRNAIKLVGERSSALDLARGRLVLMSAFFVLVYIFLAARAVDVTVIQGSLFAATDLEQPLQESVEVAGTMRADILDRNGVMLATSLRTASLYADPLLVFDPAATAEGLTKIFPKLSYGEALRKLQSKSRFVWLQRNLTPQEQQAVLRLGEPGLEFKYENRRFYPQGPLATHLVGYAGVDSQGLAGIERSFDQYLRGDTPLMLTLDVRLQHALRREMQKAMEEFQGLAGAGLIMDVRNGEVLAGVSLPDFDPHDPGAAGDDKIFSSLTQGSYELGSVFKIFSTAAFLETHDLPMSTEFDAREPLRAGRYTISDYHAEDRLLTIPEVFIHSSNIGSAMMGQSVGGQALRDFYEDIGLLAPLDFEVLEMGRPQPPQKWGEVETMTASYGHGIATTPIQLVSAVSSIINGGHLVRPTLVLNKNTENSQFSSDVRIVSPQTAHRMRQLLRLAVTDGTGSSADVPGYRVGGKTGTANKRKIGAAGYDAKRKISSFIGVFPMEAPRYAVFIMVDEPKGHKGSFNYATGGWVAAPAAARVISSMASILGIPAAGAKPEGDMETSLKQYISVESDG